MLPKVNTHSLEAIGCEKRNQTWVFFLELLSDVFKGLTHGVFDHLFFCFLDFFESFVEIVKDLYEKRRSCTLELLPYFDDLLFMQCDCVDEKFNHVAVYL